MTRRHWAWLAATALLTLLTVVSAPAFPMQEGDAPAAAEGEQAGGTSETVETILREQEELLRGERFSYDPSGRRDPFRSLVSDIDTGKNTRPPGIRGMLVTELDLSGVVADPRGDMAMVTGPDNKGYFLRVGDTVYDGTVIAVDPRQGTVTFRQKIDDPRIIKPYRDVVKRLVPLEDEESADE